MKLVLQRTFFSDTCTIGWLYQATEHGLAPICHTLEDKFREIEGQPVSQWKVQDKTAIPRGTYEVKITYSNRFKVNLPLLLNVPGFTGIRIHSGNHSGNTEGCILVGETWDGKSDWIGSSKIAMSKLFNLLDKAEDPITITIS